MVEKGLDVWQRLDLPPVLKSRIASLLIMPTEGFRFRNVLRKTLRGRRHFRTISASAEEYEVICKEFTHTAMQCKLQTVLSTAGICP